jgi:hypothetical protein
MRFGGGLYSIVFFISPSFVMCNKRPFSWSATSHWFPVSKQQVKRMLLSVKISSRSDQMRSSVSTDRNSIRMDLSDLFVIISARVSFLYTISLINSSSAQVWGAVDSRINFIEGNRLNCRMDEPRVGWGWFILSYTLGFSISNHQHLYYFRFRHFSFRPFYGQPCAVFYKRMTLIVKVTCLIKLFIY